ncbi:MAG: prepilin-type N-terminal cleavage/methylation domain-containing protein [Desulforegulaceae bacterium]|nr:prepilin-type N-terminal cleavage/methylation domain-containing protein [Desulforegulaceae bacterium]
MNKNKGFTFIEVITVIVIIGIISAVAIAKSFNFQETANENSAVAKFKTHLVYARTNALNSDKKWGIGLEGNLGYYLFKIENNASKKQYLPGEENLVVKLSESGNLSISGHDIVFNSFGHPSLPSDSESTITGSEFTINFSLGNKSLKVHKSGYIK